MPYPRRRPRISFTKAGRALISRSRTRGRAWRSCCPGCLMGTKRRVGRVTASQIASASRVSFFGDLTYALTNGGAISRTSWPCSRKHRAQSWALPHASIPMRSGGNGAIKCRNSLRASLFRSTTCPVSSMPTTCNTGFAMSRPSTRIVCAMGLASSGSMVVEDAATILAHESRTAKRRVHSIKAGRTTSSSPAATTSECLSKTRTISAPSPRDSAPT
jgi:hypothetical protein